VSDNFAAQLAKWTILTLQVAKANGVGTIEDLATRAGVGAATLHAWKSGSGKNAGVKKILAVARAAGVPEPAIDRTLRFSGATGGAPMMEALLREAAAAIKAATQLLEAQARAASRQAEDVDAAVKRADRGKPGSKGRTRSA